MVRNSRYPEEWERKKRYLIRSLFEDVSLPSTIAEGPETLSSPSNFDRAASPLPELIIEVEPKKPNPHDEPEELYEELAKEMRRLYRKDFLDIDYSTSSSEETRTESLNCGKISDIVSNESNSASASDDNMLKDKHRTEFDASDLPIDNDIDSPKHQFKQEISNSKESCESTSSASKSVKTQTDVYSTEYDIQEDPACEQQGFTASKLYRPSKEDAINVSKPVIESIECGAEEADKEEGFENFAKDTDASKEDSSSESSANGSHASPEIMRQQQFFASLGTPPDRISKSNSSISKTIHLSMEGDSKEYSENVLETNLDAEIEEHSGDGSLLLVTSTPTRKRTSARSSTETGHKQRRVSYSSSSSFESVANAATQTSFSDHEIDWSFFWSNFFVGIPTVYNICSCSDHVCTT